MNTTQANTGIDRGQVNTDAARVYEEYFVPALFEEWAPRLARVAQVKPGDKVLDVACGTGVLARYLHQQVQPNGQVTGLDLNEGMLAVAQSLNPEIKWDLGNAESLPYEDNTFDAVVSQFGLMFYENRIQAIQEMLRVLKPGQSLAVAVWDQLYHAPGFRVLTDLLQVQFGSEVADKLRAPYMLGDAAVLLELFQEAGVMEPQITTSRGVARFPSIRSFIYTNVRGWVFSDQVSDKQLEELLAVGEESLKQFAGPDGKVAFDNPAHIVIARKEKYIQRTWPG